MYYLGRIFILYIMYLKLHCLMLVSYKEGRKTWTRLGSDELEIKTDGLIANTRFIHLKLEIHIPKSAVETSGG